MFLILQSIIAFGLAVLGAVGDNYVLYLLSAGTLILTQTMSFRTRRLISAFNFFTASFWGLNFIHIFSVNCASELYYCITLLSISLFYFAYYFFTINYRKFFVDISNYEWMSSNINRGYWVFCVFIMCIVLGVFLRIIDLGALNVFSLDHTRGAIKENSGVLSLLSNYIMIFTIPFYFLIPLFLRHNKVRFYSVLFISISVIIVTFLILRTRSVVVANVVSMVLGGLYFYLSKKGKCYAKIPGNILFYLFIFCLFVFIACAMLRIGRGLMEGREGTLDIFESVNNSIVNGDMNYGMNIDKIVNVVEKRGCYLDGQSYYRLLFIFIPRSSWPEKPENTQQVVAEIMGKTNEHFSLPPGAQGDAYINFGLFGFVVFFLFGGLCSLIDNSTKTYSTILFSSVFLPMFHLVRGGFTNPVIMLFVIVSSSLFLEKLMFVRRENVK